MPISSSPVSTPSAWCHVVWEKTRRCISSSAPPWCTRRRLNPSRDASLSSTTLMVSSQLFFTRQIHFLVFFFFLLCFTLFVFSGSSFGFAPVILHPVSFSPPLPAFLYFERGRCVLPCSCFPQHLIIFLSPLIRRSSSHCYWFSSFPFILCPAQGALLAFHLSSFSSSFLPLILILSASPHPHLLLFSFSPTSLSQLSSRTHRDFVGASLA